MFWSSWLSELNQSLRRVRTGEGARLGGSRRTRSLPPVAPCTTTSPSIATNSSGVMAAKPAHQDPRQVHISQALPMIRERSKLNRSDKMEVRAPNAQNVGCRSADAVFASGDILRIGCRSDTATLHFSHSAIRSTNNIAAARSSIFSSGLPGDRECVSWTQTDLPRLQTTGQRNRHDTKLYCDWTGICVHPDSPAWLLWRVLRLERAVQRPRVWL